WRLQRGMHRLPAGLLYAPPVSSVADAPAAECPAREADDRAADEQRRRDSSWAALAMALSAAYALGALFLFGRWLCGHYALRRILRGAGPAPLPVTRLFATMTPDRHRPRLLV